MPDKALENLFHDTLKDIYYAERQILKALPGMARGAQSRQLAEAFEKHHDQTQTHVERLQQVFELIGKSPRGKTCPAIDGIIEEGEEVMAAFKDSPALDRPLWHPAPMGQPARPGRGRTDSGPDAGRGSLDRRASEPDRARGCQSRGRGTCLSTGIARPRSFGPRGRRVFRDSRRAAGRMAPRRARSPSALIVPDGTEPAAMVPFCRCRQRAARDPSPASALRRMPRARFTRLLTVPISQSMIRAASS